MSVREVVDKMSMTKVFIIGIIITLIVMANFMVIIYWIDNAIQ